MLVSAGMAALSGPYKEMDKNFAFQDGLTFERFKNVHIRGFYYRNLHDGVFSKGSGVEKALMV